MPPAAPATAQDVRPLSETERKVLDELLSRDSAAKGPSVRLGDAYLALTNLVVPRRNDPTHQGDLVYAGEVVHLTPDEAAGFLEHGDKRGRQVPVVQRWDGPEGSKQAPPRLLPRQLSGRVFVPGAPPPGSDAERPDPAGASRITYAEQVIPEAREPVPGSESSAGDLSVSAMDITPGTANAPAEAVAAARERTRRR